MNAEILAWADMYIPLVAKMYAGDDDAAADYRAKVLATATSRKCPESYLPRAYPNPPHAVATLLHGVGWEAIDSVVAKAPIATLRQLCEHRLKVTEVEAHNAQRLFNLASSQRGCAADPKDLGMADEFARLIREGWNCTPPPAPADLREWSVRKTRSYKTLPRYWREVEMPVVKPAKSEEESSWQR